MYYFVTVFSDKGTTEILKMKRIDRQLISLYQRCIGSSYSSINLLLDGELLEWEEKLSNLSFLKVNDLVDKFEYLRFTDSAYDYEELQEYIVNNYKKGEE